MTNQKKKIIKNIWKRWLEKGNGRGFHEKQCISDCTIAVCVCMATCSMYVPYFLRIFLILFYVSRIIFSVFLFLFLDINFQLLLNFLCFFSLSLFLSLFLFQLQQPFIICGVQFFFVAGVSELFDVYPRIFSIIMLSRLLQLCDYQICIKFIFALNKVSHLYLFI